jgi:hypothetical protein
MFLNLKHNHWEVKYGDELRTVMLWVTLFKTEVISDD